jgi:hypothetical protein
MHPDFLRKEKLPLEEQTECILRDYIFLYPVLILWNLHTSKMNVYLSLSGIRIPENIQDE